MKKINRPFILPADVMVFLDVSYSTAWRRIDKAKAYFDKEQHQNVTFDEFAEFEGISVDKLFEVIHNNKKPKSA